MKTRGFYISAVVLALVALILQCVAREMMIEGSKMRAAAINASVVGGLHADGRTRFEPTFDGRNVRLIGFASGFAAAIFILAACLRREPGRYSAPLVMLVFSFLTALLL